MKDVLVTCPPMLGQIAGLRQTAAAQGLRLHEVPVVQTLDEATLASLLPGVDGWIIGDDPATRRVLEAGRRGRLRAVVKWGIGIDNVDFAACADLGLPVANTPQMFGAEVADVAIAYVIGLARHLFAIDRGVRAGLWPKPTGISLSGRRAGVIGLGDVGRQTVARLQALGMTVVGYDPATATPEIAGLTRRVWPDSVETLDVLVFTCALTPANRHMLNGTVLSRCQPGVRIVNVARGPLIDEAALAMALRSGHVGGVALDVFEAEPLPASSPLRSLEQCILGTHNASNTVEAVLRASRAAIERLAGFLANAQAPA